MPEQTREEWLAARRTGIGGSDAGAICGLSPWGTQQIADKLAAPAGGDVIDADFQVDPYLKAGGHPERTNRMIAEFKNGRSHISPAPPSREQWLAQRRTGIGSSDAAAVCGLSRWASPLAVYLDKLGLLPAKDSAPMRWGLKLEEVIAEAYREERPGIELAAPKDIWRHQDFPWMIATLDRLADHGRIVELKTANAFAAEEWGEPGTDEIPEAYLVQVQHQLAVARSIHGDSIRGADVAVLIGGADFRIYSVEPNDIFIGRLIRIEADFWSMVEKGIPPPEDYASPHALQLLEALYRPQKDLEVELGQEAVEAADKYRHAKELESVALEQKKESKARLIGLMQEAAVGRLPDGRIITRKAIERKGYSVDPCTYFDFRIREPKGVKA